MANFDTLSSSLPDGFNSFMVTLQTENFAYLRTSKPPFFESSTSYFGVSRSGVLLSISSDETFPTFASFFAIVNMDEMPLKSESGFAMFRSKINSELRVLRILDSSSSFSSDEALGVDSSSNLLKRSCLARREYLAKGNLAHNGRLLFSCGNISPRYFSIFSVPRTSIKIFTAVDAAVEFPFNISSISKDGVSATSTSVLVIPKPQHDGDDRTGG
mmetsp:Transcript_10694/g.23675  ORF Transcript_10694/g.23675 Transcript_10694/m.23675 type:complete len:215 (-) Transcript_10694:183-827(-)